MSKPATNPIIDRARQHFAPEDRRIIEVPEWGDADGSPLLIYHKPVTLADKARLRGRMDSESIQSMWVHTLIMKAEDVDGKPLFTLEDKRALMNSASPAVIERVAGEILLSPSVEEVEKN